MSAWKWAPSWFGLVRALLSTDGGGVPTARHVFLCANGMVVVFGADDQQISRAQGRWLRDAVRRNLLARGVLCPDDVKIAMQGTEDVLR